MRQKNLILGSAMWAWTIPEKQCYALLDHYYQAGGRQVDCATNYPINKKPKDFRKAEQILQNWMAAQGVKDLEIMMKVGSLNNLGTPDNRLTKSFLLYTLEDYWQAFGSNLHTFMIHWDNRTDPMQISESLDALKIANDKGLRVGLSGIGQPEIYADLNATYQLSFRIQCKHNVLASDLERYEAFGQQAEFIAYGINAGGLKLNASDYRKDASLVARGKKESLHPFSEKIQAFLQNIPRKGDRPNVERMNHLGLIYAYYHPQIQSILSGPSRIKQLEDSLQWMSHLSQYDYLDCYEELQNLLTTIAPN